MATTLAALRQAIGARTAQPFFRRLGAGATSATATGGSTTTLIDTNKLLQPDNYWRGSHLFLPTSGESRELSAFAQSSKTATWLEAVASAVQAGTAYEIWSQFTGQEVNAAINMALRDAWPFFFDTQEQFLVIVDTGLSYSLTGLSPLPRFLAQVSLEHLASASTGTVTTVVAQNRLKDTGHTFTSADVGKSVRIYAGTSKGDRRTVSSFVDANTIEVSVNFTSILATDSQYLITDTDDEFRNYELLTEWSVDSFTNPTTLRLGSHPWGMEGYLLRLIYEAEFATLSTEAATTSCPREFVELSALARLYQQKMALSAATEVNNWQAMFQATAAAAQAFALQNRFRHVASTYTDDQVAITRRPADYPF